MDSTFLNGIHNVLTINTETFNFPIEINRTEICINRIQMNRKFGRTRIFFITKNISGNTSTIPLLSANGLSKWSIVHGSQTMGLSGCGNQSIHIKGFRKGDEVMIFYKNIN